MTANNDQRTSAEASAARLNFDVALVALMSGATWKGSPVDDLRRRKAAVEAAYEAGERAASEEAEARLREHVCPTYTEAGRLEAAEARIAELEALVRGAQRYVPHTVSRPGAVTGWDQWHIDANAALRPASPSPAPHCAMCGDTRLTSIGEPCPDCPDVCARCGGRLDAHWPHRPRVSDATCREAVVLTTPMTGAPQLPDARECGLPLEPDASSSCLTCGVSERNIIHHSSSFPDSHCYAPSILRCSDGHTTEAR